MSSENIPEIAVSSLSLSSAATIVDAALVLGRRSNFKPLTVAVLDAGGHLVAFKREDASGILRPQIAVGKAWGALGMRLGGRVLAQRAEAHPGFYNALNAVSEGRMVPVPGGVLVRGTDNAVIGAVGISGDIPDNDERCAIAGIEQAGLIADAG
ncbi:GlcG/HbpS family heme-binding protein [Variovorax terrae]|uniref:Heme-binding protein n=1 Tax=Variovorax terrae TaxID=2923278 RepID=A0A9X1VXQ7_9BURK|nr:heme-binding protein [Variovorax terrae]MCJ0765208.1 heme-binding protein [Variovorax terrae]